MEAEADPESDELVDEVDEQDRVIRVVSRRMMRAERLRHRAVFVAVMDGSGRLLVHRRAPTKDLWPGWCDIAVGGVVGSGETYEHAARRELAEEVGVTDCSLEPIDGGVSQSYEDSEVRLIGRCFRVIHPGPFVFADGEVEDAWWVGVDEIDGWFEREQFLPDSLSLLWPVIRPSMAG
jgi:isopentenyldiphosphate isomerase